MADTRKHSNRLSKEKSPYLLQHAHNPVDWYPWGEEAFSESKKQDKPIFLSVGYSTCYWCHVMEREVFENEDIAKLMNDSFINIKVDREERPDLDRIYMMALQAMVGAGGWPMNMFLTPSLKPFYGATYIPPKAKYGRAGFEDVVAQINEVWKNKKADVIESGNKVTALLASRLDGKEENDIELKLTDDILHKAFEQIKEISDDEFGGFGKGNKFPRPIVYDFLLSYYHTYKTIEALDITAFALQKMYYGGMYDHLGGGFHRYSVDNVWRVPHFEKMLYDQAQLVNTYLNAYRLTNTKLFKTAAEETLRYVMQKLTDKNGGFYSAEDAESAPDSTKPDEKEEGEFYLWEKPELEKILGNDAAIAGHYFGVLPGGNTLSDPHNVFGSKNVLYLANDVFDTAKTFNITPEEVQETIDNIKKKLYEAREKRVKPHLDDKILTSWNGLMISAFSNAYNLTANKDYLKAAKGSADFILNNLYDKKSKTLLHRYRDGETKYEGTLDDYAFLITALIDLYEASFDTKYLESAVELNSIVAEKFYDTENGGCFDVPQGAEDIILRTKESYDGAEPSGNTYMTLNLLRLGIITTGENFTAMAQRSLKHFYNSVYKTPFSSPGYLLGLNFYLTSPKEIIISGSKDSEKFTELLKEINKTYNPFKVVLYANEDSARISPFINNVVKDMADEKVYVCENYACSLPVSEIEELKKLL